LQAELGAAGEHAVGLGHALGDEVVDQYAEVGLVARRQPGRLAPALQGGVEAGEQPLGRGLFVASGAVDLPSEEQAADLLGFEAVLE